MHGDGTEDETVQVPSGARGPEPVVPEPRSGADADGARDETVQISPPDTGPEPTEPQGLSSVEADGAGDETVQVLSGAGGPEPAEPRGDTSELLDHSSVEADGAGDETVQVPSGAGGPEQPESAAVSSSVGSPSLEADRPERSILAAVLLNLTGLGLGYIYLRRWLRVAVAVAFVVMMVVVAFTNNASENPWLWRILVAAWVVGTAFDAWLVARHAPRPRTGRQRLVPVAVGLVAVAAVVAGHIGYAEAGRAIYAAGVTAQGSGDCVAANRSFDMVTGPFELTLSRDVPAAALGRAECTEFLAAENSERTGAFADAVEGYRAFQRDHPQSLLDPFATEGTRRVLLAWAEQLRSSGDLGGAIDRYRDLLGELAGDPRTPQVREDLAATYVERAAAARGTMAAATGQTRVDALRDAMNDLLVVLQEMADTPTAAGVPQAILDTFGQANNAVAEGRFCDALPVLDYAVTVPAVAGISGIANTDRARSLFECGLSNFQAGDYDGSTTRFETLVADYPNDPGVAQARSALISSEVGSYKSVPMPLPAPIDAPASESVQVFNASSSEVRVLIAGPTALEITLPACLGCPSTEASNACPAPGPGMPSVPIRLRTGTYHVLQDRATVASDITEPINVQRGGGQLTLCVTPRR
jgi:hypothetical protein